MAEGQAPQRGGLVDRQGGAMADPVTALSRRLGLPLPDRATALAALTHKSYVNEHRDEQGLSEMARALDLGALLRLGRGEELTGGRQKASLLADAMEAVIAAVFLGDGLLPVLTIVDRFLGEAFARAASGTLDRDFKTQLQELAQSLMRATPRYRVVAEHGPDHSKTFEVETDVRGEVVGHGAGRSKKDAEQAAAKLALGALARRIVPRSEERRGE